MSRFIAPCLFAVLCVVVSMFSWGCGGDGDSTTVVVTKAPSGGGAEPQTLKSDSATVTGGGPAVNAGTVTAPGAGKIVAVVSWAEAGQLTVFFKKGGPENYGWVNGDSPLNSVVEPVASGEAYTFYMSKGAAGDVNASYTITFDPE